jgi:hypothetical protein
VTILDGYYAFEIGDGFADDISPRLTELSSVEIATPNGSVHELYGATREPNDYWYNHTYFWDVGFHHTGCDDIQYMPTPHYRQWHLPRGGYDRAWTVTTGDSTNVIAIIDSSFEIDHPDLNKIWAWNQVEGPDPNDDDTDNNGYIDDIVGWDFGSFRWTEIIYPGDNYVGHDFRWWEILGCPAPWECTVPPREPWGSNRHGTNMASIISVDTSDSPDSTGVGLAGINWETKILPIKIGNQYDYHIDVPNTSWIAMTKALEYLAIRKNHGLNIIALNMSLTFDGVGDIYSQAPEIFTDIFYDLRNEWNIVLLGGAGNFRNSHRTPYPVYPCRDPNIFCATCVGYNHQLHLYSQFGEPLAGPYIAEDVDICTYGAAEQGCGWNRSPYDTACLVPGTEGLFEYPPMMIASSENAHSPYWSFCGDVDCAPEDSCSRDMYDELTHIWGVTPFLTSGATAQLSGLVGLVASAFPNYGPDEIENKILQSVTLDVIDPPYPELNNHLEWNPDIGVANAWKAVTRWGEVPFEDLSWSGEIWISGDIVIPAGSTLSIAPGTVVNIAYDDVTESGFYTGKTEIIVDGTLQCIGTNQYPIIFRRIGDDGNHTWGPIVIRGTDSSPDVQLEYCNFQNMTSFVESQTGANDCSLVISNCNVETVGDGILLGLSTDGSTISVDNLTLDCLSVGNYGVRVVSPVQANPQVDINTTTITGYSTCIEIGSGSNTSINELTINDATGVGVFVSRGLDQISDVTVDNASYVGVLHNTTDAVQYSNINISNCGLHGMYLMDPESGTSVENTTITQCGSNGIRVEDGQLSINPGVNISNSGQINLYVDAANVVINGSSFSGGGGCIEIVNGGHAQIANCIFSASYYGVAAGIATADLSGGGSQFNGITGYFLMNGNPNETMVATGNCYNGSESPRSSKFIGVGPTVYLPASCQ